MKGRLSGKHRGQNPLRGLYHLDAIGLMGGERLQERMRVRIAADLHDDIGASLSQIAILSEAARR